MQKSIYVRKASPEDAAELIEIYKPYVESTAISFEYEVPSLTEFASRIQNTLKSYPYLVALRDKKIIGYAYTSPFAQRIAYRHSAATSIYVARECHGAGVGRLLYEEIEKVSVKQNITNLYACIAYTEKDDRYLSTQSADFHAHMGYTEVGRYTSCGTKFGRWYDMIWMEKHIAPHTENPEAFIPYSKLI